MAVKWAVANGSWTAGATWNDGVVPTANDDVYLNGHNVTISTLTFNGTIRNDANDDYQIVAGGYIYANNYSNSATINVTTIIAVETIINYNHGITGVLDYLTCGNFYVKNGIAAITCQEDSNYLTGNFHLLVSGAVLIQAKNTTNRTIIINGNVYGVENTLLCSSQQATHTINGAIQVTALASTTNINGVVDMALNNRISTSTLNINGNIRYKNNVGGCGLQYTVLNIANPDTFTWKDVTEPRSNPFIILTDAEMNNRQQYPSENEVKEGVEYVWGEKVGTYTPDYPPESVVLKDYEYGDSDDPKTGTMVQEVNVEVGCVTPEDVRKDVPLVGMGVVGTLVVPSVDDVREGVVFDNGSVGTLIVQGGGDRLRIADFGYYTNAQSDTYIVDLTEQDKPKFAVAEERVLIEMFPDLDLDNIPDKYFDDLFVKYLKYRLIVEYYRTAGINSTFTPSEPTTEIVNYQNVRNEVWLNSANIYLKAWSKKYPESIVKPQRILL